VLPKAEHNPPYRGGGGEKLTKLKKPSTGAGGGYIQTSPGNDWEKIGEGQENILNVSYGFEGGSEGYIFSSRRGNRRITGGSMGTRGGKKGSRQCWFYSTLPAGDDLGSTLLGGGLSQSQARVLRGRL